MKSLLNLFVLLLILPVLTAEGGEKLRFFIGTYTAPGGSQGIYTAEFDVEDCVMSEPVLAIECQNPAFLAIHPSKPILYAVGEKNQGTLSAFRYEKQSGKMTLFDEKEVPGKGPCHLALCHSNDEGLDVVVVANYSSGNVVSFPILESGKIGDVASNIQHFGQGPNESRQKSPHAHGAYFDGQSVAVPDLGIDRVVYYDLNFRKGELIKKKNRKPLILPPGAGPRHLANSKNGRYVYVINELNSTISVFDTLAVEQASRAQDISTLPEGVVNPKNSTAEIQIAPNGRFLYGSNRGDDSIAVFSIDPEFGKLTFLKTVPSGGVRPRFFCLDPSGSFLFACNEESGNIALFSINKKTGIPTPTSNEIKVSKPVCLVFAP